jgi:predicted N-acetyltransferase YhbS
MNNVIVRPMIGTDLPAADRLRELARWNQTLDDWQLLLDLEPRGCFVAERGHDVIGTVTTTTYGKALAWIGMMLVHPSHRRCGVGTLLMRRALDFLQTSGVKCIRLDATPLGRPVYEKLGFVSEWSLTRHERPAAGEPVSLETSTVLARDLTEQDWPTISQVDAQCFGLPRERLLRRLPERCRRALVCEAQGRVVGWGLLRPGMKADYLGPLTCVSADVLSPLVAALLQSAPNRAVFWDVPDENEHAAAAARRFGFRPLRPFTRMRLGPNSVASDPRAQFAVADPALG